MKAAHLRSHLAPRTDAQPPPPARTPAAGPANRSAVAPPSIGSPGRCQRRIGHPVSLMSKMRNIPPPRPNQPPIHTQGSSTNSSRGSGRAGQPPNERKSRSPRCRPASANSESPRHSVAPGRTNAGVPGRFSPTTASPSGRNHRERICAPLTAGMNALRFAPHPTTEAASHSSGRTLPPERSNANPTGKLDRPFAPALSPVQAKTRRVHPDANN